MTKEQPAGTKQDKSLRRETLKMSRREKKRRGGNIKQNKNHKERLKHLVDY